MRSESLESLHRLIKVYVPLIIVKSLEYFLIEGGDFLPFFKTHFLNNPSNSGNSLLPALSSFPGLKLFGHPVGKAVTIELGIVQNKFCDVLQQQTFFVQLLLLLGKNFHRLYLVGQRSVIVFTRNGPVDKPKLHYRYPHCPQHGLASPVHQLGHQSDHWLVLLLIEITKGQYLRN